MAFGFTISNNSGDIVVDSDYANHTIAESGNVASPALGISTITFASTYTFDQQPMIFGRCTGDFIGFIEWTLSGGNVSGFKYAAKAGGSSFDWKLAVTPTAASSDTYGLRIYDGSANLVFDSGLDYITLIDAITITPTSFATGNTTHNSGTTPFYCLSSGYCVGAHQTSAAPTSGMFVIAYKAVDATHVGQDWVQIASIGALTGATPRPLFPTLLVMDGTPPSASTAYGINIWKGDGSVLSTMTSKLTRFMYHTLANAGASSNANVTGLVVANCVGFALPRGALGFANNVHDVTLTAGNVAWAPASVGTNVQSDIYVVQYK